MLKAFLVLALCLLAFAGEKQMNPLDSKPIVFLKYEGFGCLYNIRFNDIPVENVEDTPGVTTFERPITMYLTDKENTISLEVLGDVKEKKQVSFKDEPCYLKVTVSVGAYSGKERYRVLELNYIQDKEFLTANSSNLKGSTSEAKLAFNGSGFGESSTPQITIGKPHIESGNVYYGVNVALVKEKKIWKREIQEGFKVNNTFSIPLPFNSLAFLKDAQTIPDNEQTKQELLKVYERIWGAIKKNDVASLKSLFEIRTKNWAQAMYESEKKIDVLQALQEEIDDPNKKLYIPSTETVKDKLFLNIFSHGKMANLTKWSYRSIFGFDTINTEGSSNYDLTFSKINGEWKVVE